MSAARPDPPWCPAAWVPGVIAFSTLLIGGDLRSDSQLTPAYAVGRIWMATFFRYLGLTAPGSTTRIRIGSPNALALMFLGHFSAGFGAKPLAPRVSLGTLFLAAQFVDLLWPTLLLLGLERVRIDPAATAVTPLAFDHYPISHSLLATCGWALLVGLCYFLLRKDRIGALVLGALVLSHWLLDVVVHRPDLPLYPGGLGRVGMSLWSSLPLTLAVEIPLFALGVWLYTRATRPADSIGHWGLVGLVLFLLVVYGGNLFASPPPSVATIAWVGQAQWLLVIWAYWIDRHRLTGSPGPEASTST